MSPKPLHFLASVCILVSGCGPQNSDPVFCKLTSGMRIASISRNPRFSCDEYERTVEAAINDKAMPAGARYKFKDLIAWEKEGWSTDLNAGYLAYGWSECWFSRVTFHVDSEEPETPMMHPWETSLTHELVHIAQNCAAMLPIDDGADKDHANWYRDDLYNLPWRVLEVIEAQQ